MVKKKKQLSQAEIWDDTELLDSWNEAKLEYQLYHSIDARGERVEDVLRQEEAANDFEPDINANAIDNAKPDGVQEEPMADAGMEDGKDEVYSNNPAHPPHSPHPNTVEQASQSIPCLSQAIVDSVPDESLKNLMMSWYYAGYYTGFHEGKKQAENSMRAVLRDENQTAE
ncbi:MAG: hypothetical protein Q9167_007995 [Letrouitia subvulpina]